MRAGRRRLILAVAAVALTLWVLSGTRGLFSGDSGVKLAQAHSLWTTGFTSRALVYDRELDPEGSYFPYGTFAREVDGERQGIYSLTFTAVAAPLVGVFGLSGTALPGLAGGIAILFGLNLLLGRMGASPAARLAASIATVAATPILFYSGQFTEHTPSVGLTVIALALACPDQTGRVRPLKSGALVAFAATMRPECYVAVAGIGLSLVARPDAPFSPRVRDGVLFVVAALATLLAYWGLNVALSGTWDPVVTAQPAVAERLRTLRRLLVGDTGAVSSAWLLVLVGAVLGALVRGRAAPGARVIVGALLVALSVRIAFAATGRTLSGIFAVTPIAAYGLAASVWNVRHRQVWLYSALTLLALVVLNKSHDAGGLQFGSRLLLPVLPTLVALAASLIDVDLRDRRWLPLGAPLLLILVSVAMFVRGAPPAYAIAKNGERAVGAVSSFPGRVVITAVDVWQPQILAPVLLEGKVIYFTAARDPRVLLERLVKRGEGRLVVVSPTPIETRLRSGHVARTRATRMAWLRVHDVSIEEYSLQTAPPRQKRTQSESP